MTRIKIPRPVVFGSAFRLIHRPSVKSHCIACPILNTSQKTALDMSFLTRITSSVEIILLQTERWWNLMFMKSVLCAMSSKLPVKSYIWSSCGGYLRNVNDSPLLRIKIGRQNSPDHPSEWIPDRQQSPLHTQNYSSTWENSCQKTHT